MGRDEGWHSSRKCFRPITFLNTLPSTVCDSLLLQYADDTTIICTWPSPEAAADLMNQ